MIWGKNCDSMLQSECKELNFIDFHQDLKWFKLSLNVLLYKYKFLNKALVISFQHSKTRNITAQYWTRQHNIYKWLGPTPKQIVWKLFTAFGQTQGGSKSRVGPELQMAKFFRPHILLIIFYIYSILWDIQAKKLPGTHRSE